MFALALVACALASHALAREITSTTVTVTARDGRPLATDVHFPADDAKKWPVVLVRTPYNKDGLKSFSKTVCPRGYVLVVQDLRGRFASEGNDSIVFMNDGWGEHRDGHDTLEWIAKQPWCDGNICTWGGSAVGITQVLMAPYAPRTLKAQYVQVAFSDMYSQAAYQGGVFRTALLEAWLRGTQFDPESLDAFVKHPKYGDFWKTANAESVAEHVNTPGIYWGGWYDIFLQGTINSFDTIHNRGGEGARGKCRLILGPWAHGTFSELKYPANSNQQPTNADGLRFFDHHARGIDNGVDRDPAVSYYVMGDPTVEGAPGNVWRSADNWPPPSTPTPYYFHGDGTLATMAPTSADAQQSYKYDPLNPVPTVGGQELTLPKGPMDQRAIEGRKDILFFTSAELTEPLEITGRIHGKLFVSSDCPDTDFTVKLCDVYPDGRSMLVTDGILRARYRKSFETEDFLESGQVYELTVDLWSTSLIFNRGHKIRIAVSSSNSPRFDPNPNTGKPFRADNDKRVATNTLHLSAEHPSHILLPVHVEP